MNSWYLVVLIFLPVVGALTLAAMSGAPVRTVKLTALVFSLVELGVAAALWVAYTAERTGVAGQLDVPFRETFSVTWIPYFDINFSLGVDGISLTMIALIAVLMPIVLGASWEERLPAGRTIGGYFALLLVLQGAMVGVFAATNVFVFYVMFEVMLIPMYFLVGAFGGVRRAYAATKFFLYSLLGGLLMLASVIGLYVASAQILPDGGTFDWVKLRAIADQIPESTQMWIFAGFAIAFAIKAPLVPLHTWLPDAGTEAPVGAGTLLVGVLDKVGTFGFLRICLPLLPAASSKLAWLIILLAVLGIIYGAIVAAGQTDLKRFVTFTSIAHFGFIALGVFAFTTQSIAGAALYMVNHGIATGLLFLVVGMLTTRGGSKLVGDYGGVWKVAPILGGMFLIAALATIAMPGTNSFISEFLVLIGTFGRHPAWGVVATIGIVLAAVYMLWIFQRTMTGPVRGAAVVGGRGPEDIDPAPAADPTPGAGETAGGPAVPAGIESAGAARPVGAQVPVAVAHAESGAAAGHGTRTKVRALFGDLTPREITVLTPLVLLIIFLGVYPQPVLDVINPTAERTMVDAGYTDPVPAIDAPLGGGQ
ncbi:complex I subunit 4 family protein [Nakamurella sp.]|uniref:complex I subunit 4 family protein n=1 Tax=Nakamurella sp. TaxID=1869182 RepID=UPI003B3AFE88